MIDILMAIACLQISVHLGYGSIRGELVVSICEECCMKLGDVDHIYGTMAQELEARTASLYDMRC